MKMTHVVVLDPINEDIFFCGSCKHVFNDLPLFIGHKEKCVNTIVQKTQSDNKDSGIITIQHIPDNTQKKLSNLMQGRELSCYLCKKKFKKVKTFRAHLKIHNDKPYQCVVCGRCFIQNSHLQRHVLTHKVWPGNISETTAKSTDVDIQSFSCVYCNSILSNYSQFRTHMKTHISLKKYKCIQENCNSFYESIELLIDHVSRTHTVLNFTCQNCHKVFFSLEDIALHYQNYNNTCISVQSASEPSHYKCPQCDSVFRKAEKLSLHMLLKLTKKPCIYCNKVFASDKRLRMHMRIHRKVKTFECNICSTHFSMKKYLSAHMLKHGERDYRCKVCKQAFKRKDSLQRHMRSHQIRKVHKCPFKEILGCKKEFGRSDNLQSHIKNHSKRISIVSTSSQKQTL